MDAPTTPVPFVIHRAADLKNLPPLRWLVRHHLFQGSLALLIGLPGSFKSFFALWLAQCIAFGQSFDGHKVEPGGVLYAAGEGMPGFARREEAWRKAHKRPEASDRLFFCELRGSLFDPDTISDLRTKAGQLDVPLKLIVIDTLAASFAGADENCTQDMGLIVSYLRALQQLPGNPSVLVVHHTPRNAPDRERGSTALRGNSDTVMVLQRKGAAFRVELSMPKQKDCRESDPAYYALESVHLGIDEEGEAITSGVLVAAPVGGSSSDSSPFNAAIVDVLKTADAPLRRCDILAAIEPQKLGSVRAFDSALADLQDRQLIKKSGGHHGVFHLTNQDQDIAA